LDTIYQISYYSTQLISPEPFKMAPKATKTNSSKVAEAHGYEFGGP
jgi:hypothetical protein